MFNWLTPNRALEFPDWLWERLQIPAPQPTSEETVHQRVNLIDSRPWFIPFVPGDVTDLP